MITCAWQNSDTATIKYTYNPVYHKLLKSTIENYKYNIRYKAGPHSINKITTSEATPTKALFHSIT